MTDSMVELISVFLITGLIAVWLYVCDCMFKILSNVRKELKKKDDKRDS